MIFVAAGIILLYFVNLKFAQRVFRAQHPRSSWHPLFVYFINAIIALTIITIIMLIVAVVQSLFTLNPNIHRIDHDIQKYGSTCFAIISFLPFVLVILGLVIPRRSPFDRFGTGHFRSKIAVLLLGSALLCLGASFKAGTIWLNPVPQTRPLPWYLSRACFYIFNFTVEICVVYMYALLRVDQRFHVPDGAKGPGSYSATAQAKNKRMVSAMDTDVETGEKRETL
jgi:hypothetical protein